MSYQATLLPKMTKQTNRTLIVMLSLLLCAFASIISLGTPRNADAAIGFSGTMCSASGNTSGTTLVLSPCTASAGNSIIVTFVMPSNVNSVTVADSAGNTYVADVDRSEGTVPNARVMIFRAHNVNALSSGSITITHPTATNRAATANQFSGLANAGPEQTASAGGASNAPSSGSVTTVAPDQLLIGAIGNTLGSTTTFTQGGGWTFINSVSSGTTGRTIHTEYRIVSSNGTYAADGTLSDSSTWAAGIATYKMATAQFTVNKDFSDNNVASVTIHLECTSGTVAVNDLLASEAQPAVFTVNGFIVGATCTATEPTVPTGYTVDETNCATVGLASPGTCTITNTLNTAQFTVNKDFSDNNVASVTIHLECTTGSVAVNDLLASEAQPAVFTVNGFTVGATCTATEPTVPTGYTVDETNCATVGLASPGTCTITNTLNTAQFTVKKDFDDGNQMSVTIHLECTTGTVATNDLPASEATPAVFTVNEFTVGTTCTATEPSPPQNYSVDASGCVAVGLEKPGECTILNNFHTTAVNVESFGAKTRPGKNILHWRTTTESQIAGFNIYRRTKTGEWKQINAQFRAAKYPGTAAGAKYRFKDVQVETGKTYYYRLEVQYLDGHSERTNVVQVITADGNAQTPPPRREQ